MRETEAKELLISRAREASLASYSPYSRFRVGASVLDDRGKVFCGCNVENSSYPVGICAERLAAARAVMDGARGIEALAVFSPDSKGPCYPCGMCLQFLSEFASPGTRVFLVDPSSGEVLVLSFCDLLPFAFGASSMGGDGR